MVQLLLSRQLRLIPDVPGGVPHPPCDCTGVFIDDATLSMRHALLFLEHRGAYCSIKALESRNKVGTMSHGGASGAEHDDTIA